MSLAQIIKHFCMSILFANILAFVDVFQIAPKFFIYLYFIVSMFQLTTHDSLQTTSCISHIAHHF